MGKFCVKAAIVSSLAIAEEDYDTTIGAPIELKRNLIARPLKKGQTPQIIREGGSLRALNEERGLSWYLNPCNWGCPRYGTNENSEMKEVKHELDNENSALKEVKHELDNVENMMKNLSTSWNSGNYMAGVSTLLNTPDRAMAGMEEKLNKAKTQVNQKIDELKSKFENPIENAGENIKEQAEKADMKINEILVFLQVFSLLPISEEIKKLKDALTETLTEASNKLKDPTAELSGNITKYIEDLSKKLKEENVDPLFDSAEVWIKGKKEAVNNNLKPYSNLLSAGNSLFSSWRNN